MVPIASEESTGSEEVGDIPPDPLRHVVQVALAIYLMPVVAIVCAIGGVSILLERTTTLATRLVNDGQRGSNSPIHLPIGRPTRVTPSDRRRTRVER